MATSPISRSKQKRRYVFGFDRTYLFLGICLLSIIVVSGYLGVMASDYSYQAYTLNDQLHGEMNAHNETRLLLSNVTDSLNKTNNRLELQGVEVNRLNVSLQSALTGLIETQRELENARGDITVLRTELNYARSGGSFILHDPTSGEMKVFLQNDSTSNNTYNDSTYTCSYFSRDVKNNAESRGIRCAIVLLVFNQTLGHAMIGFNTTDRGFIYVEPQNDIEQNVTKGGTYWGLEIRDVLIIW